MDDVTLRTRVPSLVPSSPSSTLHALRRLVHEHLLERTEGMPPASLAAFIAGWGSALDLLRRSDVELPWVSAERHRWIGELIDAVQEATRQELDDE